MFSCFNGRLMNACEHQGVEQGLMPDGCGEQCGMMPDENVWYLDYKVSLK